MFRRYHILILTIDRISLCILIDKYTPPSAVPEIVRIHCPYSLSTSLSGAPRPKQAAAEGRLPPGRDAGRRGPGPHPAQAHGLLRLLLRRRQPLLLPAVTPTAPLTSGSLSPQTPHPSTLTALALNFTFDL